MRKECTPPEAEAATLADDKLPPIFVALRDRWPRSLEMLLLARISSFNTEHGCYMSIERLAAQCGHSRKDTRDMLNRMLRAGTITAAQEFIGKNSMPVTCYRPRAVAAVRQDEL